ncbi:MAG: type phosphodiesterase/nucleotide pyrophosphatase [Gammaproteobacteria bacterium]|nr:type phosphodiesterase/nucleotide pyrophosphatase [Gammaproteobacteria bacterium]
MYPSVRRIPRAAIFAGLSLCAWAAAFAAEPPAAAGAAPTRRNAVIFVADGLRHDSVNSIDAPTLLALRQRGVHFANSHSLFPTTTTPNAAVIATGHYLGDTGDFSNTEYVGYPIFNHGNFGKSAGTPAPFLENDEVIGDVDDHASTGNFLNEVTLLALAREQGFNTAAIGKLGPAGIQDVTQLRPVGGRFAVPQTVILDDSTGKADGIPLAPEIRTALATAGLGIMPAPRDQPAGTAATPGTLAANVGQQKWFADATTKAVLPAFASSGRPFVLLFWSRDPDGTQHNQGDSLNKLQPGINGPTSRAAVANADANLRQILDCIDGDPALRASTDVFVTSDHGFATSSRHEIDSAGHGSHGYATTFTYAGSDGKPDVVPGWLPPGFLAIDLAHELELPLFDPDSQIHGDGAARYEPVDPTKPPSTVSRQRPALGNGLIGGTGAVQDHPDATIIVATSGGADLIYVPGRERAMVRRIVAFLGRQDYVGGLFVDPAFGAMPGALPLTAIALEGATQMPRPSVVVSFKSFLLSPGDLLSAVQVSDTALQEGQGMHGHLGRDNTFNNMAAVGPDFKQGFVDALPVGNADIAPTLAQVLGLELPSTGRLRGRVLAEALVGGPDAAPFRHETAVSSTTPAGLATVLQYQEIQGRRYFDTACFVAPARERHARNQLCTATQESGRAR